MNLFDLVAKITLDSSEYEKGLNNASEKAKGFGGKLQTAMKVGGAAIAAVTTATTALAGSMVAVAGKTAEYGDNIDKMSQKMGLSAQAYQEWDAIMQHSGTSMETMKAGMKTLANAVENGNEAFQRIGLTQEQIASMSQEDLFAATIAGLQKVDNETERTYLAGQLLGRGATELGALLNTSAEDTEAMRQRVHELGGVMSDDAVKAAARYQDSLQDMQTAFSGLSRNMISKFLPAISTVMDGLTDLFSGNGGLDTIKDGIDQFVGKLSEEIPKVVEVGGNIIVALATAISDNLPTIFQAAVPIVMSLAQGIIQNQPALWESALGIILSLAEGLADSLPELIPTIVDVILQIVDTLIDNVDKLVEAAIEIVIALAEGLINALPKLLEKAPEIIMKLTMAIINSAPKLAEAAWKIISVIAQGIANKFSELVNKGREIVNKVGEGIRNVVDSAKNWGRELINNFISGLLAKWEALKSKVSSVASSIAGFFKHSVPREGPFKRDDLWGAHLIENFTTGMLKEAPNLLSAADSIAESVRDSMMIENMGYSMSGNGHGENGFGGMAINGDVYITVEGTGKNAEQIGRDLYKMLVRRGGVAYAY